MVTSSDTSTAVQLSLFEVTPPAQHAAQGRRKGPSAELRQQRGKGTQTSEDPFACPLGRNRCIARPHDCELWQYFCVPQ